MPSAGKPESSPLTAAVFLFVLIKYAAALTNPEVQALLLLKYSADPTDAVLTSWNSSSDPCTGSWLGASCLHGRVYHLVLENLGLRGGFPRSITLLTGLRLLSLKENGFSGQVPDLSNLTSLRFLFLAHNRFSGGFPASLCSIPRLYRLDLSHNNFSGRMPLSVNRLTHLMTLRLEENGFSGPIPRLTSLFLQNFNVSGNQLTGEVPVSVSGFPAESFLGNRALCGPPLEKCKVVSSDPTRPGGAMASPVSPRTTVASSPTAMPSVTKPLSKPATSKISWPAIIGIILGDIVILGLLSLLLYCYFWTNYSNKFVLGKSRDTHVEKVVYSSSPYPNPTHTGFEKGKMVFFDGDMRFELEDLLRASAEMLGKGGYGTAYKAVLDDGSVVVVKRLKDMTVNGRKEFEQQMEFLGRLRHPNLVELKAYYFARDEKLLVYDYMPNGNLFWLLHGNRGPGRTPLDWPSRLKIASGAARGLAFIHGSCGPTRPVHGNIKSTNILIDRAGNPRLSDFGLSIFAPSCSAPRTDGYRAPESPPDWRKQTRKSDVYSFGVLLLELLTGKYPYVMDGSGPGLGGAVVVVDLPRWARSVVREEWTSEVFDLELVMCKGIEEELVGLLQVALACAEVLPDQRPRMDRVVRMIEDLRGAEVSPLQEMDGPGLGLGLSLPAGSEGIFS